VLDEPDYRDHAAVIAAEFAAAGGAGAAAGQLAALAAGTSLSETGPSRWVNVLRTKKFSMAEESCGPAQHAEPGPRAATSTWWCRCAMAVAGPALFCAPPLVGASWCYLALLPHSGPSIRCTPAVAGTAPAGAAAGDMAELARDFADQIRITQPHGPYHLFGWSLGGNIAHAIAEELERRGAQVGLLAIGTRHRTCRSTPCGGRGQTLDALCLRAPQVRLPAVIEPDDPDPMARMLAVIRGRPGLALHEWPDRRYSPCPGRSATASPWRRTTVPAGSTPRAVRRIDPDHDTPDASGRPTGPTRMSRRWSAGMSTSESGPVARVPGRQIADRGRVGSMRRTARRP